MFGFGIWEMALLLGVVVLLFGVGPVRAMIGRGLDLYRKVNETRQALRDPLKLGDLLREKDKKK